MVLSGGNTGLRSRKIENDKLLPIYRYDELQLDCLGPQLMQRATPHIATGVEREEEEEKHLQAALVSGNVDSNDCKAFIPTPDASVPFEEYDKYYAKVFNEPRNLIRFSGKLEDAVGCPFSLDYDGVEFVKEHYEEWNKSLSEAESSTEYFILALENFTNSIKDETAIPTLEEAQEYIKLYYPETYDKGSHELLAIFDYWRKRRFKSSKSTRIFPILRVPSDNAPSDSADPFVCFRKREVKAYKKAQRGNFMSRESLENVESLIASSKVLLDMFMQRALARKTLLQIECQILEHIILLTSSNPSPKFSARDLAEIYAKMLDKNLISSDVEAIEKPSHAHVVKKSKECPPSYTGMLPDDLHAKRKRPRPALYWRQSPSSSLFKNVLNSGLLRRENVAGLFVRQRVGRGGRILLDRQISFRKEPKTFFFSPSSQPDVEGPFSYPDDDLQPYRVFHVNDTSRLIAHRIFSQFPSESELRNPPISGRKDAAATTNQVD